MTETIVPQKLTIRDAAAAALDAAKRVIGDADVSNTTREEIERYLCDVFYHHVAGADLRRIVEANR